MTSVSPVTPPTFYCGEEGKVMWSATASAVAAVTAVRSWSMRVEKDPIEITTQGDTHRKFVGGLVSGSGSCELLFTGSGDETKDLLDSALEDNEEVSGKMELYLHTHPSKSKKLTFDVLVTSGDYGVKVGELQVVNITFKATGTITGAF